MKTTAPLQKETTDTKAIIPGEKTTRNPLQLKKTAGVTQNPLQLKKKNETGLPDNLKAGVEALSGYSMDDVRVHYNSDKPAQLQAYAYAQGTNIHVAPGQEKHLPHEAWHVVQQKQGRVKPTMQLKSRTLINDQQTLESEADRMGWQAGQSSVPVRQTNDGLPDSRTAAVPQPVVQRNKHLKRLKNVLTLGIRKAYVNNKRAKRAVAAVGPQQQNLPPVVQDNSLDSLVGNYEKARYYHHALVPDYLKSINDNGLLNYEDRMRILGEDKTGMSKIGGKEYEGDERKGVFLAPRRLIKENERMMASNLVRAFMSSDRTVTHNPRAEDVPDHEMIRDINFAGGAVITKNSVLSGQVTTGNMQDLLDNDDPKLNGILGAIASHYPKGTAPSQGQMKILLADAIRERRLSNAAFDIWK